MSLGYSEPCCDRLNEIGEVVAADRASCSGLITEPEVGSSNHQLARVNLSLVARLTTLQVGVEYAAAVIDVL